MQMQPVACNVNGHTELKPEHVVRVQDREGHEETHGRTAVSQLVKHCSKLGSCTNKRMFLLQNSIK